MSAAACPTAASLDDLIGCLSLLFGFCRIKSWVDKMQEDLVTLARTASGVDQLAAIYLKNRDLYTVEANNPRQLVEIAARDIEKLLSNRSKALVVRHDM
uniref:Voltage-dependent calcium channel subunit alpha-2/delta-1 n=1 Tax=Accipiter nisus TaxID=211598 RepID=A0A8B9RT23_9AVES